MESVVKIEIHQRQAARHLQTLVPCVRVHRRQHHGDGSRDCNQCLVVIIDSKMHKRFAALPLHILGPSVRPVVVFVLGKLAQHQASLFLQIGILAVFVHTLNNGNYLACVLCTRKLLLKYHGVARCSTLLLGLGLCSASWHLILLQQH